MIWTIWRQHRGEALIVALTLALLVTLMIVTGIQMRDAFQSLGVGPCLDPSNTNPNCAQAVEQFKGQFSYLSTFGHLLNILLPLFVGMLIGAPLLAREIENRTYLLAWTQGVTRRRWLTTKLVCVIGVSLLAVGALTALMVWWRGPFDQLNGRLANGFDFEGGVPIATIVFTIALAIAMGASLRHVIPAMLATMVAYLTVRVPIELWARPYLYEAPITQNLTPLTSGGPARADWSITSNFVDQAGRQLSDSQVYGTCLSQQPEPGSKLTFMQCVQAHHWLISYIYQPADRFLRFQVTEVAIYAILTALLVGLTFWLIQRRIR
jgi:hypothetical protein